MDTLTWLDIPDGPALDAVPDVPELQVNLGPPRELVLLLHVVVVVDLGHGRLGAATAADLLHRIPAASVRLAAAQRGARR